MTTLGKIVGGGMPMAVYGGRKEIMDCVAPLGGVYQVVSFRKSHPLQQPESLSNSINMFIFL